MIKCIDGNEYIEMTEEEIAEMQCEIIVENGDPLKEMAQAMSTASSLAQMREAAKEFLEKTE